MNRPRLSPTVGLLLRHPGLRLGLVVLLLAAMTVSAVAWTQWRPVSREHAALQAAIVVTRHDAMQRQHTRILLRAYRESDRAVLEAEQKLRTAARQADLVTGLARLAEAHDVRILGQSHEQARATKTEGAASGSRRLLNLRLEADYAALRAFLNELPALPSWVTVEEARLEGSRESPGQLHAQLRLAVLRQEATP